MRRTYFIVIICLFPFLSHGQLNYNSLRDYYLNGYDGQVDENEGSDLNHFLRRDYLMFPRLKDYSSISLVENIK